MSRFARPRRSVLYMPGANARALQKARGLSADALIFDLEDAVAPAQKATAREQVVRAVADGGYGRSECVIRVNGLQTVWAEEDLAAAATVTADAVLIPKVEGPDALDRAAAMLPKGTALWAMMETPAGILIAASIAAHPGMACLVMGTNDLVKDLRVTPGPDRTALMLSLQQTVLAARAAGIAAVDGVFTDLDDPDGFESECRQGADLGFDGKTLIHPRQVEPANRLFGPDPAAVAAARHLIAAWQQADGDARGVVAIDGRMVEALHIAQARRLVAQAEAIAQAD